MGKRPHLGLSLRTSLIVPIAVALAAAISFAALATFRGGRQAVEGVAEQLRARLAQEVAVHIETILAEPEALVRLNAAAIERQPSVIFDAPPLLARFQDQIEVYGRVSSVYFGNRAGGLVNSGREVDPSERYTILTDGLVAGTFRKVALTADGRPGSEVSAVPNFDARTRPWYRRALEQKGPVWSGPYVLFTGQDLSVSVSNVAREENGAVLGVAAADLFLTQLSRYLRTAKLESPGRIFVLDEQRLLVACSDSPALWSSTAAGGPARRLAGTESEDAVVRTAAEAYLAAEDLRATFRLGRELYFLNALPLQGRNGLDWTVVVVGTNGSFQSQLDAAAQATFRVLIGTLVVSLLAVFLVAQSVAAPILTLHQALQSFVTDRGVVLPAEDIRVRELNDVAVAFNTMTGALRKAEREQRTLHRELQHRVKNSMAMILALIRIERDNLAEATLGTPAADGALADLEHRVFVVSDLYRILFEQGDGSVSLDQFVAAVCSSLETAFADNQREIKLEQTLDSIALDAKRASSVGLILNELVTNAYKYAFRGRARGLIRVELHRTDGTVTLRVSDDGRGLQAAGTDPPLFRGGFGLGVVDLLAQQLDGTLVHSNDPTTFTVQFPY